MASVVLQVRIFCNLKKKQASQPRRTGKATVSDCDLKCACVSFVGKPVSNKANRILGGHFGKFPW